MKEKTKVYTSNTKFYAWKYLHKLTHFPCIRLYKCSRRNRRCWCSWNSRRKERDQESTHQHLIWTNYGKFINSSNKPSFFRLWRLAKMNHFRATLFFPPKLISWGWLWTLNVLTFTYCATSRVSLFTSTAERTFRIDASSICITCTGIARALIDICQMIQKHTIHSRVALILQGCNAWMLFIDILCTLTSRSITSETQFTGTAVRAVGISTIGIIITWPGICRTLINIWRKQVKAKIGLSWCNFSLLSFILDIPSQVIPSPVNPCLQVHVKEPSVLAQSAFSSHAPIPEIVKLVTIILKFSVTSQLRQLDKKLYVVIFSRRGGNNHFYSYQCLSHIC